MFDLKGKTAIITDAASGSLIGVADLRDYCASKWAVAGMTKAAAVERAPFNIRVNSVHLGLVLTPMVDQTLQKRGPVADVYIARMPLNPSAAPSEIASVFAFLASDAASFVTGAALPVDGGLTAQ